MDLMQKKQTSNRIKVDLSLYNLIQYEKIENRVTDVESELKDLRELINLNNHTTNDNQIYENKQNIKLADYANRREKEKYTEGKLETITTQLSAVENQKLQIQIVGQLVDEIRETLKRIPKQKNNYRRKMLLMFHEALKQHYTKHLFDETQIKALNEIARTCNETFVTKEQYFKMDTLLCDCDLDMMPDME